jgi:G:T-mismatch repair DNA endonuclease (very short patch repair protein)
MADSAIAEQVVHDKATRSYKMSQIRSRNTKPEMLVRKFLHAILQVSYTLKVSDAFL